MKQYLLPAIAGILAISANIVVAAPKDDSHEPQRKVESKGHEHDKQPEKSSNKGPVKAQSKQPAKSYSKAPVKAKSKAPDRGHNSWNDRLEVRAQVRLQKLGYYRGAIDGDFGRGSRAALVRFQQGKRLRQSGVLDSATIRALGI
ncbi:peptidoglycan-binding domain-containing protein [Luteolibacter sp. AS25]|uniref:peptidoglycan-binding domain-containing protein n=1 Tax=Luteolibacter sp. AS25 TaxID=3135776 RepID=UPI00398AA4FE